MADSDVVPIKFEPDRDEAEAFLNALDPVTDQFTFQTFDDNQDRKDGSRVRILYGSLAEHWGTLAAINCSGCGVYITVNEIDLQGRKKKHHTHPGGLPGG